MSTLQLSETSTCLLGDEIKLALDSQRKGKFSYHCIACNRKHSGVYYCEFCLANELYARRKTMAFMRLDLCVQSAVCLIAKVANQPKLRESQILGVGYSKVFNESYIILDEIGDSENAKD